MIIKTVNKKREPSSLFLLMMRNASAHMQTTIHREVRSRGVATFF